MIKPSKYGVTLLELMIVIGIIGILFVVIFNIYNSVSQITFRLQSEKTLMSEVLSTSQILQNLSEKSKIDYLKYGTGLEKTKGITNRLYLTGDDGAFSVYSTGNCLAYSPGFGGLGLKQKDNLCVLVLQYENGKKIYLTQTGSVYLSSVVFKVVPYSSNDLVFQDSFAGVAFNTINQPGFWMNLLAYSPNYSNINWTQNVKFHFQQFFSTK